jgi:AsmA-like C-terminal region
MTQLASTVLRRRQSPRWRKLGRILRRTLYVNLALVLVAVIGLAALYLRLSIGPMSVGGLPERVATSLAARIGPGWNVEVHSTALQLVNRSLALNAAGLDIRNPDGALVLRAPHAIVSVDGLSLLSANFQPRSVEFRDLQLRAALKKDGSLTFTPAEGGGDPAAAAPPAEAAAVVVPPARAADEVSPVSVVVGSLFELIVGPGGVMGALDRARLTNARLTLVGADRQERTTFTRLDATFDRTTDGGRRFDATVDGPRGAWQLSGDAASDGPGTYRAKMIARDAPVQDLVLLSGASAVPATSDLKLTGRVDAAFADGRATQFRAQLASNAGEIQIDDPDTTPLPVERLAIEMFWDESRRALVFPSLELKGGATQVRLEGEVAAPKGEPGLRAAFTGRGATLEGAKPGDAPVRIDEIEAQLRLHEGLRIEKLRLKGPALEAEMTGLLADPQDPKGLKLDVRGRGTAVRTGLRLWPQAVAPPVRNFLVDNLKAGSVDSISIHVAMTGADITAAIGDGPIPDEALNLKFALSNAVLSAAEGLPPLSHAVVTGVVTGTRAAITAPGGRVEMPDGRTLAASEGSFVVDNFWPDDAVARIDFRLYGGADGLGALLHSPLVREIAALDLDPATMKGRADLRVAIPLLVNDIPKFVDLPLAVTGRISDLSVDRIFGKDRLEGANLTLAYDRGDLAVKGEGKLAGSPALIDVRQSRDAGGEATVSFALDDAARARRGMGFGSQLTGVVALKAVLPLGAQPSPGIRVEADLARAAINGLIPGWVKPTGRPGKMNFVLVEGPATEIKDLVLDSGPVQLRGTALLSDEGAIDKADLTTFRLSPGDDMRAQIERVSGTYKVVVRGNVGDARPFAKTMGTSGAASNGRAAQPQKDAKDVDLDVVLNILTGHNDEAITNASIKASLRKDSVRQLDVKGRLGSTNLSAQTVPRPGTNPVILVQAEDAGAALRFLDVYRRMNGGELVMQMSTGDGPQTGFITLNSFALHNEPALRRIIPTQSQVIEGRDKAGNPQNIRIDVNQVSFTKARVDFTRTAGRLDFKNASIWGQQIGFTLGGFIDYPRDRVDIAGTFVPAFGLNNAFAQVPLFGPLLGGGQYEGLIAVNFRISGQATAPTLTVNPLSAVAPGFLRKLFGTGGGAPETPTGSLPPIEPSERMNN